MVNVLNFPESTPIRRARELSRASSAKFFYLADAIARHHEPTETQLQALESSYLSTAEFLTDSPEFRQHLVEVHAHGSRLLGTMTRPRDGSREGFDIDWIARLKHEALRCYGGVFGPTQLLNDLHSVLQRYADKHGLSIRRWERCVTLGYANGMTADIAPVIDNPLVGLRYGDTHGLIPDRQLHIYEKTNPRGYGKYFDKAAAISPKFGDDVRFAEALNTLAKADIAPLPDAQEVFNRLLSRLVQLLKLHRNVAFGNSKPDEDLAPPSIFITTLAACAYADLAPISHEDPLDLLVDIVEQMPKYIIREPRGVGEFWVLPNPSAPSENLAESVNTFERQTAFVWWKKRLTDQLTNILDAIEDNSGLDVLLSHIEAAFGKRAAQGIRNEQAQQRSLSRNAGRAAIITSAASTSAVSRAHSFYGED